MFKRLATLLLALIFSVAFIIPIGVYAQEENQEQEKVIRVGWHEAPYFITDQHGRRSGYSYEYLRKIASYTGWKYEYVTGSWSDLLQMLKNGEIDLMSNISFTEERARDLLYTSQPMGTEAYYIFVSPKNAAITSEDYTALNGKTVGVTEGAIQTGMFRRWAEMHDIRVNLVEIKASGEEALRMLGGQLDAFITMDIHGNPENAVPVCKIGASDFFFAISKSRPELLGELDAAMNRIQSENKYFNQQLHTKYLKSFNTDRYLTAEESEWLSRHGTIRVGYQDNYMAFCARDEETGELTGALKDYLAYASTSLENARLHFEAVPFPTAGGAIKALKDGEVDCVFPANLTVFDSETLGVLMTPPLMRTEMDAVVRASDQKEFSRKQDVTVAVNKGNTNYDMFIEDHFPGWRKAYFVDTPAGLEAVAAGNADCVIISNYRYHNISKQCEKLHLTTLYTGVDMDYCFAVREGDTALYSLLSRTVGAVPDSVVHAALTYYSTEDVKVTFTDLVMDNLHIIMTVIALVLLIILALLLHGIRAEKKVREEERRVNDLNKRVFFDALTSVRNKGAFSNHIQELQDRLDCGEPVEFAIGVFDCDNLKKINDQYGHDKGDVYIKATSQMICRVFQHSPVFRIGGDEFAVILQDEDYRNRDALNDSFEEVGKEICAAAENRWEQPRVSIGIAAYDPACDTSVNDTIRRADECMYENKRIRKANRTD